MTKRSYSFLATVAIGIGLVGAWSAGCSLDPSGLDTTPQDTLDRDPPVQNVVPRGEAELSQALGGAR